MKYSDPYLPGVTLGLVLLGAYVFASRRLGASGAFAATASESVARRVTRKRTRISTAICRGPAGPGGDGC